jgi:hypothetical protein
MNIKRTNKLKTNSSGFGHIEMLLLVVAVVVIGGVGFFVYNNSNKKTASKSTAHAGGYTTLGLSSGITVSACKTYNSVYGGIYSVKVLITKAATTPAYRYDVSDMNGITKVYSQHTNSTAYYAGTVAAVTINMSVVNRDEITINAPSLTNSANTVYYIIPGTAWNQPSIYNVFNRGINNITNC